MAFSTYKEEYFGAIIDTDEGFIMEPCGDGERKWRIYDLDEFLDTLAELGPVNITIESVGIMEDMLDCGCDECEERDECFGNIINSNAKE